MGRIDHIGLDSRSIITNVAFEPAPIPSAWSESSCRCASIGDGMTVNGKPAGNGGCSASGSSTVACMARNASRLEAVGTIGPGSAFGRPVGGAGGGFTS